MITLVQDYFCASARRFPDKPAVSCEGDVLTFAQLDGFSNAFARALQAAGVKRGGFVPFFMQKSVRSI